MVETGFPGKPKKYVSRTRAEDDWRPGWISAP